MKKTCSRREVLEFGLGSAMLGMCGRVAAAAVPAPVQNRQEVNRMTTMSEYNRYGEELENYLLLRRSPIAVKMVEKEADIPKEAVRPNKDRGYHLAQCQTFAMSSREGTTVAMGKEDHWCPAAPMAYGMVKRPASVTSSSHPYECFEYGKYAAIVTAPLKRATFEPDVVIVYSNTSQLRGLLLSMDTKDVPLVNGHFFPPSCAWSVVNPMMDGKYWVVLPDPGEYQRALTGEGDMMFSIPKNRLDALMAGVRKNEHGPFAYRDHQMFMQPDFPRPDFYKEMFKSWGLDSY
jgi:uncharacterized protein (DUF169 family)